MAKYVIELSDSATGEIADVLVVETERSDELLAMAGGDPLRPWGVLPLSASDIESIVVRFDLSAPAAFLDGWLRQWSFLDELPYTVHTGRELRLMLAGEKPLAAFVDDTPDVPGNGIVPEDIFAPYVSSGRLVKREIKSLRSGHVCREVLYAVPSEAWRIDAYLLLMDILDQRCWSEGMERMQGRLLGYTGSQNDVYIELLRKRESEGSEKPTIASRRLLYSFIGESEKRELTIRIVGPYLLVQGSVDFAFDEGAAGCDIEFDGLPQNGISVYGADTLQSLALAVDIDPYLRGLSRTYNFFFETGEPYFHD